MKFEINGSRVYLYQTSGAFNEIDPFDLLFKVKNNFKL